MSYNGLFNPQLVLNPIGNNNESHSDDESYNSDDDNIYDIFSLTRNNAIIPFYYKLDIDLAYDLYGLDKDMKYYESKNFLRYNEVFAKNKFNGQIEIEFKNKIKYIGELKDYKMEGYGIISKDSYSFYEGNFNNNLFDGLGLLNLNNGDCYKGEFKKGKICGKGKVNWFNGDSYEGEFKNNRPDGYGILIVESGNYKGNFINGLFNGKGELKFKNSTGNNSVCGIECDTWENGIVGKKGKLNYTNRSYYIGDIKRSNNVWFLDDVAPEGFGKIYNRNGGIIYDGQFHSGLKHGPGIEYFDNGIISCKGNYKYNSLDGFVTTFDKSGYKIYEGYFKLGTYHGEGTIYYDNGTIEKNNYRNGKKNGMCYYTNEDLITSSDYYYKDVEISNRYSEISEKRNKDDHESCSICRNNLKKNDLVCMTKCNHYFHCSCLVTWLNRNDSCPICRAKNILDGIKSKKRKRDD